MQRESKQQYIPVHEDEENNEEKTAKSGSMRSARVSANNKAATNADTRRRHG